MAESGSRSTNVRDTPTENGAFIQAWARIATLAGNTAWERLVSPKFLDPEEG